MTDMLVRRGMILQDLALRTVYQLKDQKRDAFAYALESDAAQIGNLIDWIQVNPVFNEEDKLKVEAKLARLENQFQGKWANIKKSIASDY